MKRATQFELKHRGHFCAITSSCLYNPWYPVATGHASSYLSSFACPRWSIQLIHSDSEQKEANGSLRHVAGSQMMEMRGYGGEIRAEDAVTLEGMEAKAEEWNINTTEGKEDA